MQEAMCLHDVLYIVRKRINCIWQKYENILQGI